MATSCSIASSANSLSYKSSLSCLLPQKLQENLKSFLSWISIFLRSDGFHGIFQNPKMFSSTKLAFSKFLNVKALPIIPTFGGTNSSDCLLQAARALSLSCQSCLPHEAHHGPRKWPRENRRVYPPQEPGEERRPAYICHMNLNFKHNPDKLWYVACLVRGMSIDEAIRQLEYVRKKGAWIVKKTLEEAQDLAVKRHHVEFKSNLWVAESFVGKGLVVKGIRRHARRRIGFMQYKYAHYFVRLEEGPPVSDIYSHHFKLDGPTLLQKWIEERRNTRIYTTL